MDGPRRFDVSSIRLVVVTDSLRGGIAGLVARTTAAVLGGATMIQVRLKDESPRTVVEAARALRTALPDTPLVVNERADVALAAGAHGVHLGVHDLVTSEVRRIAPEGFIIGASASTHTELERARGADYVGLGPVYAMADAGTALGIDEFAALAQSSAMPVLAVGGVTVLNIGDVMRAGAHGAALMQPLIGVPSPADSARALRAAQDASGR